MCEYRFCVGEEVFIPLPSCILCTKHRIVNGISYVDIKRDGLKHKLINGVSYADYEGDEYIKQRRRTDCRPHIDENERNKIVIDGFITERERKYIVKEKGKSYVGFGEDTTKDIMNKSSVERKIMYKSKDCKPHYGDNGMHIFNDGDTNHMISDITYAMKI